jgi:hypothetical protein
MALDDDIRSTVDAALAELTAQVDNTVRQAVARLVTAATAERDDAFRREREALLQSADLETRRRVEEVVAEARIRERQAEMAGVARLADSIRTLDGAVTLSEVLDALAFAAAAEELRAAVLVVRQDRLNGWKLMGFGELDARPRSIDLSVAEAGVVTVAITTGRAATTRDEGAPSPGFAALAGDRFGLAVPVTVGGRAVAVVYVDAATPAHAHQTPSGWPEVIEILARHAARCLEALTVQRTASGNSPRFWVQAGPPRPGVPA